MAIQIRSDKKRQKSPAIRGQALHANFCFKDKMDWKECDTSYLGLCTDQNKDAIPAGYKKPFGENRALAICYYRNKGDILYPAVCLLQMLLLAIALHNAF